MGHHPPPHPLNSKKEGVEFEKQMKGPTFFNYKNFASTNLSEIFEHHQSNSFQL